MMFMKKLTLFRHKSTTVVIEILHQVTLVIQASEIQLVNVYDEMVLKIFVDIISKPHVERLSTQKV